MEAESPPEGLAQGLPPVLESPPLPFRESFEEIAERRGHYRASRQGSTEDVLLFERDRAELDEGLDVDMSPSRTLRTIRA